MKILKAIFFIIVAGAIIAGVHIWGMKSGAELVRNGLVANFPTIKNLILGSAIEVDSTITLSLTKSDNELLFMALKGDSKSDSLWLTIPYYGRYAIDVPARSYRVIRDNETIEAWLPAGKIQYCELKFDKMLVDGKNYTFKENAPQVKNSLYSLLIPALDKIKSHQTALKTNVTKVFMFYFMPYKFQLKVYIDNEQQVLPVVPGINKNVDEYIKEVFGANK